MNRNEQFNDLEAALMATQNGLQSRMWTALPAIITKVSLGGNGQLTCECQPALTQTVVNPDQSTRKVKMPLLLDVPIFFPQGGGFALTFPVQPGDECLVVFSSRCIDGWWLNGGVANEAELRMHDLSDGFAFVGFNSQPNVIPNVSTNNTEFRSIDGNTSVQLTPAGAVNIKAPGNFTCVSPNFNVDAGGNVVTTGEGTFNGHTVGNHTHTQPNDSHGDTEQPTHTPTG